MSNLMHTAALCFLVGAFLAAPQASALTPQEIALAQKVISEASKLAQKNQSVDLVAPQPLPDNSGKYLSPYTADGEVTDWAKKSLQAEAGAQAGDAAGNAAANAVARKVPFGGLLKSKTKATASAAGAATAMGGWDFIRDSSDISFNEMQKFSVYLQVTHGDDPAYDESLAATMKLYPELKTGYRKALRQAYKQARK